MLRSWPSILPRTLTVKDGVMDGVDAAVEAVEDLAHVATEAAEIVADLGLGAGFPVLSLPSQIPRAFSACACALSELYISAMHTVIRACQ